MLIALYFLFIIGWGVSAFLAIKRNSIAWVSSMWGFWLAFTIIGWFI